MYVLMDLEWFYTKQGTIFLTQLAALRVSADWKPLECFFSRIRAGHAEITSHRHMAFSGGSPEDFLCAPALSKVLGDFHAWLERDDVLCWWTEDAPNVFDQIHARLSKAPPAAPRRILQDHIIPFLLQKRIVQKNPYKIAASMGLTVPSPAHCSKHDVLTVQTVLQALAFPLKSLSKPVQRRTDKPRSEKAAVQTDMPYLLDTGTGLFHKKGCDAIPNQVTLFGFSTFKPCFKGEARPCRCLAEEFHAAKRKRNQSIIDRSQYNFVYAKTSLVFHRRNCSYILSANDIMGSVFYDACAKTGRRPCKRCAPAPLKLMSNPQRIAAPVKPRPKFIQKHYPDPQQRAMQRLKQSKEERENAQWDTMSQQERADLYTLTQPGYAFWAAAGYQTFHLRSCRKLNGLSRLKGFSRYSDAVYGGYTPCRLCKPTKKQDVVYSFPITSQKKRSESVNDLAALCEESQFEYSREAEYFIIRTPLGRWRIHLNNNPIFVDHINLSRTPDNPLLYHRQPRLFLSLSDTFSYIKRHDMKLLERKRQPLEAT